jgi:stage V sporulation protein AC
MKMSKDVYGRFVKARAPRSPLLRDCLYAFWVGGSICVLGQALRELYTDVCGLSEETAGTLTSVTLIFLAILLTGSGVFDRIAKLGGAGTLVPITGFANAVASPAIDSRAEGLVLGVGAKIFTVAGPVLLYGTLAGAVYGVIYWIVTLLQRA